MAVHKLTARKAAAAKPGIYHDGGGLRLVVATSGARKWVFRYTINGRRRDMGLGRFPDVELAEARQVATRARRQVKAGIDPIVARDAEKRAVPTFTSLAAEYIRAHRRSWRNPKHARQWVATLKTYARHKIGARSVDALGTDDILAVLRPIWLSKTETAKRLQGRIENVLDYGAAHGYRDAMNPARWRGHLDKLLPNPSRVKQTAHHPAMPYSDLPAFYRELEATPGLAYAALRFLILTACRTSEVLGARWDEVDLESGVWTVPAERMKAVAGARREHRVPLSAPALALLESLPRVGNSPFVFPGARPGRPLSNMALLQAMRRMGYGKDGPRGHYVPHGFRSAFRDWAGEVSSFPRDVCEMALAHTIDNKVEAAYRRGDLFEKRRKLMEAWAAHCAVPAGANVTPLARASA
ncbi:tyrosine-type recombinase/integrase [Dichotomicrobium thermohalophilum]|uniref:Integrase n=1 Tax=Dichotomicrobium thermohalophilum TaxID=933063 RepID=A0A397PIB0_9HYPH|nr:site-specific integrase [Dichotomicrobium thermohalophilum]RIA45411.1 integrase [Dichotomicrobium thermohalophilum]